MQGPAGMAGWRVRAGGKGAGGGEGMCECVKYCTETPPAAANVTQGRKGRVGSNSGGTKEMQQAAEHADVALCGRGSL